MTEIWTAIVASTEPFLFKRYSIRLALELE